MKSLTFIVSLIFASALQANGIIREDIGLKEKRDTDQNEEVRREAAKNPRNRTFSESFETIGDERQEEEAWDDPLIDNQGNGQTTNQKK